MQVEIVRMPRFRVACLEHKGPLSQLPHSQQRFIQWRRSVGIAPSPKHRTYACFHTDPRVTPPDQQHIDLCVSTDRELSASEAVIEKWLGGGRFARVRHQGSRNQIPAAQWLHADWLPTSGEKLNGNHPLMFHFLNVGPNLKDEELETDVYLPLQDT